MGTCTKKKTTHDRRIQRTRHLLLDALIQLIPDKGYEAITIQDIIDRANVGRSTFYSHFRDKEDLLLSGFENLRGIFEELQNQSSPETAGWNFSLALFQHVEEQQPAFKAVLGKQAGAVSDIERAIALSRLAYRGCHLALVDINTADLEQTAGTHRGICPTSVYYLPSIRCCRRGTDPASHVLRTLSR